MSIADQSCAQAVQKSKKAHNSKRNNKAVSEKKSLHRFFYPNKQSKTRKERSDFAAEGTCLNEQYAFTTSYLYLHNAYLSSTPSAQHNSRIKRTFRPQAFRNSCKNPTADDIRPQIPSCPQDMPQCANAYHGENHSRPCPQAGTCGTLSSQHCPYFLHKKADSLSAVRIDVFIQPK